MLFTKISQATELKRASSKYCYAGTLPLGLAGSGTNKFSALTLENLKYRPLDDALLKQLFRLRLALKRRAGNFSSLLVIMLATEW